MNIAQERKFDSAAALANLARSYRMIAGTMVSGRSRERLLRLAAKTEAKVRETVRTHDP